MATPTMSVVRPGDVHRLLARLRAGTRLALRAAGGGLVDFYNSDNLTFAASIAYYALLSLFPFLLIVFYVLDRITVGRHEATLLQILVQAMPGRFDFFVTQVPELERMGLTIGIAGFVLAVWASMGVFGAITSAVNSAWGVETRPSFLKHKLIAFTMLLAAGVLMMAALLLVSAVQVAEARWFARVIVFAPVLDTLRGLALRVAPTPLFVLVVGLIYYYAPNAKVRLRDVWLGAVLAGLLWRAAFAGFSWYIGDLSRFSVHGSASAIVVFLVWVYLSAVIFLYGAEVSAAHARLRKHVPAGAPAAAPR